MYDKERDFALNGIWKPKGAFLAGGALTSVFTNNPINDYDLYFKSADAFKEAVKECFPGEEFFGGMWCVANTQRAITFSDSGTIYQLMHFGWFETAQKIFDTFDFTCCMAAIDLDSKELVLHEDFMRDLAKRELIFNHGTAFPLASGLRTLKYQDKGFTLRKKQLLKILTAVNFTKATSWYELVNQIGGAYGDALNLDTSAEYNLENAVKAIDKLIWQDKDERVHQAPPEGPSSYEQAMSQIFGEKNEPTE